MAGRSQDLGRLRVSSDSKEHSGQAKLQEPNQPGDPGAVTRAALRVRAAIRRDRSRCAARISLARMPPADGSNRLRLMQQQPQNPLQPVPARLALARFTVRALRISASTVAIVALLRQQWLAGTCFAVAWLLILAAPRLFPALNDTTPPSSEPPE